MAKPPAETKDPKSDPDTLWIQVPAIYCDTYTTTAIRESKMVRIVFGDYVGGGYEPYYRCCVVMPLSDIKQLVASLNRRIAVLERPEKPTEPESEQAEPGG